MLMVLHATAVYIKTFFLLILLLFFPSEYTHTGSYVFLCLLP